MAKKIPEQGVPDADNPEWTESDFKKAKPLKDLLAELSAQSKSKKTTQKHKKAA